MPEKPPPLHVDKRLLEYFEKRYRLTPVNPSLYGHTHEGLKLDQTLWFKQGCAWIVQELRNIYDKETKPT